MVGRLQEAQASFRNLGDIIVGDYAKLKTVGTLGGCSPSAARCSEEWQFSQRDQQQAATATYRSIEGAFDHELMKLTSKAYPLGPRVVHYTDRDGVTTPAAWNLLPVPRRARQRAGRPPAGAARPLRRARAGQPEHVVSHQLHPAVPPKAISIACSLPVSSSLDPKAGGLGIYRPDFMRSAIVADYDLVDKPGFKFRCGSRIDDYGSSREATWLSTQ
jgi:hypothetical protein